MGALVDSLRQKRLLIAMTSALIAVGCIVMVLRTTFFVVVAAQATLGVTGAIITPAIAGISLDLVGHRYIDRRIVRNESFNHLATSEPLRWPVFCGTSSGASRSSTWLP